MPWGPFPRVGIVSVDRRDSAWLHLWIDLPLHHTEAPRFSQRIISMLSASDAVCVLRLLVVLCWLLVGSGVPDLRRPAGLCNQVVLFLHLRQRILLVLVAPFHHGSLTAQFRRTGPHDKNYREKTGTRKRVLVPISAEARSRCKIFSACTPVLLRDASIRAVMTLLAKHFRRKRHVELSFILFQYFETLLIRNNAFSTVLTNS